MIFKPAAAMLIAVTLIQAASAAEPLVPFVLPWDDASAATVDLSSWNHTPAGKFGFVQAKPDGHLYVGDQRIRFIGSNVTFSMSVPDPAVADKAAARMAKFGFNCIRFHHMDSSAFPRGILAYDNHSSRKLHPEGLARFDHFFAALKAHGIYSNINLLVGRKFKAGDGLDKSIEQVDWKSLKSIGMFYQPVRDLQKEYARDLLTHRNPETGLTYVEDPAVAMVEIANETGLLHDWFGGKIDELPEHFRNDIQRQWNAWLAKRYPSAAAVRDAWGAGEPVLSDSLLTAPISVNKPWYSEQHHGARATITPQGDSAIRIVVTSPAAERWHLKYDYSSLKIKGGQPYRLSFRARADKPITITASINMAHEPWQGLAYAPVEITDQWQTYQVTFESNTDEPDARLEFSNLGEVLNTIELADVSLRPTTRTGLLDGEDPTKNTVPMFTKSDFAARIEAARRDWVQFLWETERDYWNDMRNYLINELHVKVPVVGTIVNTSTPNLMADMDIIDTHAYWQHPHFPGRPWDPGNWIVKNESMVDWPPATLGRLGVAHVAGKPIICTEYNHAAPNTYSSEAPLMLAAFAAAQDFDGIFMYSYSHAWEDIDANMIMRWFDIAQHPTKMANMIPATTMFRRGDVAPFTETATLDLPPAVEIDMVTQRGRSWRLADPDMLQVDPTMLLDHRFNLLLDQDARPVAVETRPNQVTFDTSRPNKGVMLVDSPSTRGVVGFADGRSFKLGDTVITPRPNSQDWSTIMITRLQPDKASNLLIVATGTAENTDWKWTNDKHESLGNNWGKAPSLIEVIPAKITLPAKAGKVSCWALDQRGQRAEPVKVIADGDGRAVIEIGPPHKTLWYEVEVK
ncbi:hypothetical protein HED60_19045 [Planctomycetales bacterium ZRK34]|nr:hypothetical protein HED60_19045 [Planctomycetales bacterium ZRK34]